MNKRIQELAEHAGFINSQFSESGDDCKQELNRFAKLIVQECIDKIENEALQYSQPTWAFELIGDIKEHFGIEQ